MASSLGPAGMRLDRDGVRVVDTRAGRVLGWLVASGLALLGVAGWVIVRWTRAEPPGRAAHVPAGSPMLARDTTRPAPGQAPPKPVATAAPSAVRRRATKPPPEQEPTFTLLKPGEHAGLGVFPPPGTKPIKHGIIVPDDFALPEGYVRHYQTADDGRRLPPILMFHPDYEGVDAEGNPVPLPEDRVVPPEMAPPGLPLQMLDDPEHATTGTMGRAR